MKRVSIYLFLSLFFLFCSSIKIYASTSIFFAPSGHTPAQDSMSPAPGGDADCSDKPKPSNLCSNSSPVGTTTCSDETACIGGNTWSKYGLAGCFVDNFDVTNNYWRYEYSTIVCSTGDKYNLGNPPVMDAGRCYGSGVPGQCAVGGAYKTCCSGTTPVAASHFNNDPFAPDEADCNGAYLCGQSNGGQTVVCCGLAGQPACGQAACNTLGTPEPTATPAPTPPSGATATPVPPTSTPTPKL